MDSFLQDIRCGYRMLRRTPGFTAVAILTLALGIGANTAIFSVVNAVLLRPLPYRDPGRLISLASGQSLPDVNDFAAQSRTITRFGAFGEWPLDLLGHGEPRSIPSALVGGSLFETLGVRPLLGRTLTATDDQIGGAGRGNFALPNAKDSRRKLAVCRGIGLDLAAKEIVELVGFSVCSLASALALQSDIVAAMIVQEGREDLRPVAAARPDLDHGRFGRDAKEGQLLKRMARLVPCNEFRAPRRISDRGVERQISSGGLRMNSERESKDGRKRQHRPLGGHRLV